MRATFPPCHVPNHRCAIAILVFEGAMDAGGDAGIGRGGDTGEEPNWGVCCKRLRSHFWPLVP